MTFLESWEERFQSSNLLWGCLLLTIMYGKLGHLEGRSMPKMWREQTNMRLSPPEIVILP